MKKKCSKRFRKILDSTKDKKVESFDDALKKIKTNCTTKFDESIDVSFKLNLKQKKEEEGVRTNVNLPNGNGKKVRVAVLCEEGKSAEAKNSGADVVGTENLVTDITNGNINFDKVIQYCLGIVNK